MNAQELHDACVEAAQKCPQCEYEFDDEHIEGFSTQICVGKLPKKGLVAVINYWQNQETLGGSILWEDGYYQELPLEAIEIFDRAKKVIEEALKKEFGTKR